MGLVIRESIKSTIITFFGALLGGVSMLLASTMLRVEEYGVQQYLYKNATLIAYIGLLGFDYALLILSQRYNAASGKRGAYLRYMAKVPMWIGIILISIFILFKDTYLEQFVNPAERPLVAQYFYALILIYGLHVILIWIEGYLRAINKSTYVYFVHDVLIRIIYIILIALLAFDVISFATFIWSYAITFIIPVILVLQTAIKDRGFTFSIDVPLTTKDKRQIFSFAFFHALTIVSSILVFQIDSILFPMLVSDGLSDLAVYSFGIYCASILRMPLKVVASNAIPTLTEHYDQGHLKKVQELFSRSALNLQILACMMILLIICNLQHIQSILVSHWRPEYYILTDILPIMMLGIFIELSSGLNFEIIGISKYYRFNFWLALGYMLLIIVAYYIGLRNWGIIGAAWAFTISIGLFNIAKGLFTNQKLGMIPINQDTLKLLVISIALGGLFWWMPTIINPYISIIINSAGIVIVFIMANVLWRVGEDLPRLITQLKDKIFHK